MKLHLRSLRPTVIVHDCFTARDSDQYFNVVHALAKAGPEHEYTSRVSVAISHAIHQLIYDGVTL